MRTFDDATGQSWTVRVDLQTAKEWKRRLGFDVMGLPKAEWKPLGAILEDPVQMVDLLFLTCADECRRRNLTDEDFGRLLFGDAIEDAAVALIEAISDFFPSPSHRKTLAKILAAARKVMERTEAQAETILQGIDPDKLAERMNPAPPKNFGAPPTEPPPP